MEPKTTKFFSCILDDFQDYIYEGFGTILNKSRSANVGVVFCHQSLGDLSKVSEDFKNVVLTNTNIKVVMRMNDPDTCEHFAKTFGTEKGVKTTSKVISEEQTGDGSIREVEKYRYHPNEFKELGLGQGIMSIPHKGGVTLLKVKFEPLKELRRYQLPDIPKKLIKRNFPKPEPVASQPATEDFDPAQTLKARIQNGEENESSDRSGLVDDDVTT